MGRCQAYVHLYKKSAALQAIECLQKADLTDSMAVYNCGFEALDNSCANQASAKETCARIAATRSALGDPLSAADKKLCLTRVGGLRAAAREQLSSIAEGDSFFGIHSAIEGLDAFPETETGPSFEGGPATEGGPASEGGEEFNEEGEM
jgi:hypothetical protein